MWRFVLEVALAISVGANVYLLTRHADPPASAPVAVAPPRACPPAAAPVADAAVAVVAPPVDASMPAPSAKTDCSAVEKKLEETEAKLEAHLPPAERYKHAVRAVDVETRARALLDPIFAAISKAPHAYDVECHGSVCKVSAADPALSIDTWTEEVQRHSGFQGWSLSPEGVYAELATPAEAR